MSNASKKETVAVFFDVQNLYHSSKKSGGKVYYKALLDKIGEGREVVFSKAYAGYREEKDVSRFYKSLQDAGIEVMSKRLNPKQIKNITVVRAPFDVEIAVDAELSINVKGANTVVLCTGSGNFTYLVKDLLDQDVNVEVWSFQENTSDSLKSLAKFVEIPKECLLKGPRVVEACVSGHSENDPDYTN